MKETYSIDEVKQILKDIVTISFDPNPDPEFYMEVFDKYEKEMQDYIINLLIAALMARKFVNLANEK